MIPSTLMHLTSLPRENSSSLVDSKKRVLVLEDDEGVRWSLESILVHFGFEVSLTANSSQFVAAVSKGRHFDLMITDLNLGELDFDGLKAIRLVRETEPQLPIVMITAELHSNPSVSQLLDACGVVTLEKPFSLDTLMKTCAELGVFLD